MSDDLAQRVTDIEARNTRVEADKSWETSWTRRVSIALFTYIIASAWMVLIGNDHALLNAAVPTGGYLLSTISLPFIRMAWQTRRGA